MRMFSALLVLITASPLVGGSSNALAQQYPERPIRMVVPFSPGGSTDVLARLFSQSLSKSLNQTIIVENKPGAGTVVGADAVAKSLPDGYTLLFSGASTFTVNPILYKKLPYDSKTAFEPLGIIASTPLVLLANPAQIKSNTLRELATELEGKPDVAYGSFGTGSTSHFVAEMFKAALGANALHVPYKGSAPAMAALVGGHVPLTVDTAVAASPQVKAGKVKAIAVSSVKRSTVLPDVPTAGESGFPSIGFSTWFVLAAPADIPKDIKDMLVSAIAEAAQDKALRENFVRHGFEPEYESPVHFSQRVEDESERLRNIAEKSAITIE